MKRFSVFLAATLITVCAARSEQGGVRPYRLPTDMEAYFKGRYARVDHVASRLEVTPDGPLGNLYILGKLLPRVVEGGATPRDRARGIARGFLEQEAAILDLPDFGEIRETEVLMSEDGTASVHYVRFIGSLQLPEATYRIDVEPSGAIRLVDVNLVPAGSDLYRAVKRTTITEDEVKPIVVRDLARMNDSATPIVSSIRKIAIWQEPYVIWTASGSLGGKPAWEYSIDAFRGKILQKACSHRISLLPLPPGQTLCD